MVEQPTVESKEAPPKQKNEAAERARQRAESMWKTASSTVRKPVVGAGVAGAVVLAAGAIWGVTEAALAGVAAWAVFRTLVKRAKESSPPPDRQQETAHASG